MVIFQDELHTQNHTHVEAQNGLPLTEKIQTLDFGWKSNFSLGVFLPQLSVLLWVCEFRSRDLWCGCVPSPSDLAQSISVLHWRLKLCMCLLPQCLSPFLGQQEFHALTHTLALLHLPGSALGDLVVVHLFELLCLVVEDVRHDESRDDLGHRGIEWQAWDAWKVKQKYKYSNQLAPSNTNQSNNPEYYWWFRNPALTSWGW